MNLTSSPLLFPILSSLSFCNLTQSIDRIQIIFLYLGQGFNLILSIFCQSLIHSLLMADATRTFQQWTSCRLQDGIELFHVVHHIDRTMFQSHDFCKIEISGNKIVENLQFVFIQIILAIFISLMAGNSPSKVFKPINGCSASARS